MDNYEVSDKGGDLSPGLLCWGQQKRLDTVLDCQLTFQIGEALGHHMGHRQQVTCIQQLADIEVIDLQRQGRKFVIVFSKFKNLEEKNLAIKFDDIRLTFCNNFSKYFALENVNLLLAVFFKIFKCQQKMLLQY